MLHIFKGKFYPAIVRKNKFLLVIDYHVLLLGCWWYLSHLTSIIDD